MKKFLFLCVVLIFCVSCKSAKVSVPSAPASANTAAQNSAPATAAANDDWLTIDDDFMVPPNPLLEEAEGEHAEDSEKSVKNEEAQALALAEAEKKAEEERLAREAENKKIEEKKAAEVAAAQKAEAEKKAAEEAAAKKAYDDKVRAQRLEEERKAAEAKRLAEAAAAKKAEEEKKAALEKKAEEERKILSRQAAEKAEKERIAAEKAAEEKRRAAEAAAKKAEEERIAEEKRRAAEIAAAQKAIEEKKAAEIAAQKAAQEKIVSERNSNAEKVQTIPLVTDDLPTLSVSEQIVDRTPSRTVSVNLNQYLDVLYPGAGWTYLGEVDEGKNLVSFSNRSLQNTDTNFTLRALRPGYTILHFYKQDVLTNTYIDDYLEVVVKPDVYSGNQHAVAPYYAEIVPPNQRKYVVENPASLTPVPLPTDNLRTTTSATTSPLAVDEIASNANAVSQKNQPKVPEQNAAALLAVTKPPVENAKKGEGTSVSKTLQPSENVANANNSWQAANNSANVNNNANVATSQNAKPSNSSNAGAEFMANAANMNASQLLAAAKKAYTLKAYDEALEYLNMFFTKSTDNFDEAWYLRGQLFEAPNSNFQNVRTALESYQTLVERYPSSPLWKDANKRITYINRFYFKIH